MKGLLIKDFKLLKGQKNFFMTITAISIIMIIVSPGTSFPIGLLGFVGALFSLSSISYDEFDNGNAFLFSLPITRKDYVLEKYIFGLISGIMFLLLGTVISLVVIGITKTGSFNEIFLTAGSLFPTILLILSIMLPLILKFGGEKGRIAIIGVMGLIFVIGLLLIKTTEYLGIDLYVLINKLPKFEPLEQSHCISVIDRLSLKKEVAKMANENRKDFNAMLHDSKDMPKFQIITDQKSIEKYGGSRMFFAPPIDYDNVMKKIPYGKVITIGKIREYFAKLNGADFTEPITAGIFVSIAAWASYQRTDDETPYWRTLKANGELNEKYPNGIEAQKEKLEAEGHTILQKGRKTIRYY